MQKAAGIKGRRPFQMDCRIRRFRPSNQRKITMRLSRLDEGASVGGLVISGALSAAIVTEY